MILDTLADNKVYRMARSALIIIAVVALGLYVINATMDYRYKVVFIKQPCQLCKELNPELTECFTQKIAIYPDGKGGWRYENGSVAHAPVLGPSLTYNLSLAS